LMRALEVCRASGQPYSSFKSKKAVQRPFQTIYIGLEWPREELYHRINSRVDQMMEQGLLEEVKTLYPLRHLKALDTVGYREFWPYLEGDIPLEEAVDLIKRNTRRYAKRQLTWFRQNEHIRWFHPQEREEILSYIRRETASH